MNIYGLVKTTLLDYPGRIACTVFTGGCNFRCGYCHNAPLVLNANSNTRIGEGEVLSFLEAHRRTLQGMCISGGEPTLQNDLFEFLHHVKDMGYPVKIDTNGYNPWKIKCLVEYGLVDMVAMDIKTDRRRYPELTQTAIDFDVIMETAAFLLERKVEYEFRTTVVKEFFDDAAAHYIAEWLAGARKYYLQGFVDSGTTIVHGLHARSQNEMNRYRDILLQTMDEVEIQ